MYESESLRSAKLSMNIHTYRPHESTVHHTVNLFYYSLKTHYAEITVRGLLSTLKVIFYIMFLTWGGCFYSK